MTLTNTRWYRPPRLAHFIRSDAARMQRCARVVLYVAPDGSVHSRHNSNGKNIIAVVGALTLNGRRHPRALLLEIGIGRGKPYSELLGLASRRHFAGIDATTYAHVAPHLFRVMQELSDETTHQWRTPKTIVERPIVLRYRSGRVHERKQSFDGERGKRFSVSCDDELLLGDLCWAHLQRVAGRLKGFADFHDGSLSRLKPGETKRFIEDVLPVELEDRIRMWGPYAIASMAHLPVEKHPGELSEHVARHISGEPRELALARAAGESGAVNRIGDMRVYDATWRRSRVNTSVRVFEVLPRETP